VPPTKLLLAVLTASSVLVACGNDDDAADVDTESTAVEASAEGITVDGDFGESAGITIPEGFEVSGLATEDIIEGDGPEAAAGATVTVHYAGVFLDGSTFDASFGASPATFPLDQVIPGWTEGIPGMKVGGRRLLVIPSDLAYGSAGRPGIPPDTPLVFVVDLLDAG
jgi:peptidylprolyl isomerase